MIVALGLCLLLALLLLGVPVFAAIGLTAALLLLLEGQSVAGLAQIVLDHLNSATLTALPLFVISAAFLDRGGLTDALVKMAMAWLGRLRGGLAHVTVAAATGFSALSGSSVATAMAIGATMFPQMQRRGYPRPFSLGLIGAAGTLGILIPPSLALVLFGLVTDTSIPRLFLAGIVPGLLQALLLLAAAAIAGNALKLPRGDSAGFAQKIAATSKALPALAISALLLAAIVTGFVTITEAAAITALLSILAGVFVYKGCRAAEIVPTMATGLAASARIVLIVGSALLFSHWLATSGLTRALSDFLSTSGMQGWQFLLLVNLILILLGMVLEGASTILLVAPLVAPLLAPMGIDPLHFAIIMVINIEIGMLTPPVGMNLFVLASIGRGSAREVIAGAAPFVALMLGFLIFVTLTPGLATWLPDLVFSP